MNVSAPPAPTDTAQTKIASLFGLTGDRWMRHANPLSVWTRFAGLPVLVLAIWSRTWIGRRSLIPVAGSVVFLIVNPLLFPKPRGTRNWASKAVFGERIWAERTSVELPRQFRDSQVPAVTFVGQTGGLALLVHGLVTLSPVRTVCGLVIVQGAKAWYLDRLVLLFEDMKTRRPEYASWEY